MNKVSKIFFCSLCVLVILTSMLPISAFADSVIPTYKMPFNQPTVTTNSGYIELLWKSSTSNDTFVTVFSYTFQPRIILQDENSIDAPVPYVIASRSSYGLNLTFSRSIYPSTMTSYTITSCSSSSYSYSTVALSDLTPTAEISLVQTGYYLRGVQYYGDFHILNSENYTNSEFSVLYSADAKIYDQLTDIVSSLESLSVLLGDSDYTSQLSSIIMDLYDISGTSDSIYDLLSAKLPELYSLGSSMLAEIEKISSNTDNLDEWLDDINDRLGTVYTGISELSDWLDSINTQLIELKGFLYEMWLVDLDSNSKLYEIFDTLNAILSNLEAYSDVRFPEHNGSNVDELVSKEHGLIDNSEVDVSDALSPELPSDAMNSIFGIVDRVFNLHPKIIGLIVTVLGLGLLALILGR